ncbi:insulin gene enhancer protein ISL-1-like [Ornithodoros turicata]|uniref:insulin gene enhancer protein ISL-1-like n=1 Tax=Ornithodoros turicata TaxID=34597 RepID=UPI00313966B1
MTELMPQMCVTSPTGGGLALGDGKSPSCGRRRGVCVGCGGPIRDQYLLRVAPDLEWHAACLKCAHCLQFLDETCTCFVRDGKTYCKRDYLRLFGAKCSKCQQGFSRTDFVMRARQHIYHLDCFRCQACARQLIPGDEFALREDGLFCRADHDVLDKFPNAAHNNAAGSPNNANNGLQMAANAEPMVSRERGHSVRPQVHKQSSGGSEHKPTRVRTVLNEKQLHTLRTCYAANPRPDALMKEQLVEMTGLSPRVIRVWFQNKRCKDKKKSILMKQMQQHEKDGRPLSLGSLRGVPLVATSPVRHEGGGGGSPQPLEVQAYQPPWKALAEYAMHPGDIDPSAPHFQHLINQMHGYDLGETQHCIGGPLGPGGGYLCHEDTLTAPSSNISSTHIPGTPSELSSPTSE